MERMDERSNRDLRGEVVDQESATYRDILLGCGVSAALRTVVRGKGTADGQNGFGALLYYSTTAIFRFL